MNYFYFLLLPYNLQKKFNNHHLKVYFEYKVWFNPDIKVQT